MERGSFTQVQEVDKRCPDCKTKMVFMMGGCEDVFIDGEYDQREFPDCWLCPECKHVEEA